MSEKRINLEEILTNSFNGKYWDVPFEPCKKAMLEFGKQLLELAAENATVTSSDGNGNWDYPDVDKQSIIDTINQVE